MKLNISPGTIISFALLGGIGYVAYKFIKGDWQLPQIFGKGAAGAAEGLATGGVPGAVGGLTYNLFTGGEKTFYERVEQHIREPGEIKTIIQQETGLPPGEITPGLIRPRAVMQEAAEDIIQNQTIPFPLNLVPPFSFVTLGAGAGAIEAESKYKESLKNPDRPMDVFNYEAAAYERRTKFLTETPQGWIANFMGLGIPGLLQATVWRPQEPDLTGWAASQGGVRTSATVYHEGGGITYYPPLEKKVVVPTTGRVGTTKVERYASKPTIIKPLGSQATGQPIVKEKPTIKEVASGQAITPLMAQLLARR